MALTGDVLLKKFPILPRAGWRKELMGPPSSSYRSYNDEPVEFYHGTQAYSRFTMTGLVSPQEAAEVSEVCSKAQGRPILFQDPWDYTASSDALVGPHGNFSYGGVIRTGYQRCPIKIRGLVSGPGTHRGLFVKPLFYVEDLVISGTPTPFDPFERLDYAVPGPSTVGANFEPASFTFWIPVQITSWDVSARNNPNQTIAVGSCSGYDGDLVAVSVSLEETTSWMVDDALASCFLGGTV